MIRAFFDLAAEQSVLWRGAIYFVALLTGGLALGAVLAVGRLVAAACRTRIREIRVRIQIEQDEQAMAERVAFEARQRDARRAIAGWRR